MESKPTTIFRASLRPKLYREVEVLADGTLADLASAIVTAFGFDLDHAYGFYSKLTGNYGLSPRKYELFADMEGGVPDDLGVEQTPMADVFRRVGAKMMLLFDYGDDWRFMVEVLRRGETAPAARYPRIIERVGKAPPQYPACDDEGE